MATTREFRRGREEIKKVEAERGKGGQFTPFLPNIYWKDSNEEKYLLFLNSINEMYRIDAIQFIPDESGEVTRYDTVIARTDKGIGERVDPLVDDWDATPKKCIIATVVELEPTTEEVAGRLRPTGFKVATREFDRRIRDEDGELTDDTEEISAPQVGYICQHATTFFSPVESYDSTDFPIEQGVVKVKRVGKDSNTNYQVQGYADLPIDLTDLVTRISDISYLDENEAQVLTVETFGLEPMDAAHLIGNYLLGKQLDEFGDDERYERILARVVEAGKSLDKFGNKKKAGKNAGKGRTARPSQRRTVSQETEAPEREEVTASSPAKQKLEKIRAEAAAKKAGKGGTTEE